ncbi:imm11 family protein [Simiduia agarivorans]|uniref:Immunity MXAN-0049 protein domain-containing protein n=1 Tax=Simiduia agarivorans (strain DSM 21679 / JCM 13881 / BCRC 17597 / SA1) TaxID=1117647 RepID=K4KJL9_SIMAS|nr:DUF1629 domain-containing protein [Simiduia agarivorans]AFU98420.2 hypothetical protein M5M_06125 [Simiduia agarivorans SA1 = DSM 21679]
MAETKKIYSIQANYDGYKSFVLSNDETTLRCKGKPLNWSEPQPIETDEEDVGVPEADISLLNIGSIVINENIKKEYFDVYQDYCEFLPLDNDGKRYFAVNVINVLDCLDMNKSRFNKHGGIIDPVFDLAKIPDNAIFKIKEDNYTNIYCTEAVASKISDARLTGAMIEAFDTNDRPYQNH